MDLCRVWLHIHMCSICVYSARLRLCAVVGVHVGTCAVVCTYVKVCAYVYLQCECAHMHVHVCICGAFAHARMVRAWVCVRFMLACIYSACVLACGVCA